MLSLILSVIALIEASSAAFGVDISEAASESVFSCLKSSYGASFAIPRAWYSYGGFDSASITSLKNAQAAGIEYTDVYMFPCRGKNPYDQVNTLMADLANGLAGKGQLSEVTNPDDYIVAKGLSAGKKKNFTSLERIENKIRNGINSFKKKETPQWRIDAMKNNKVTYGMIWMDIEENPSSGCGWTGYSESSNCQYLDDLLAAVVSNGGVPGVYSSEYEWEDTMGSRSACNTNTNITSTPLWYAHYDGVQSFSDWNSVSFGGWTSPNIKQYRGDVTLCGFDVDEDWY